MNRRANSIESFPGSSHGKGETPVNLKIIINRLPGDFKIYELPLYILLFFLFLKCTCSNFENKANVLTFKIINNKNGFLTSTNNSKNNFYDFLLNLIFTSLP